MRRKLINTTIIHCNSIAKEHRYTYLILFTFDKYVLRYEKTFIVYIIFKVK